MRKAEEARQTVRTKDRVEFEVLAKKIEQLIKERPRMSQRKLSAAVGRDRSFVNAMIKGRVYPDFATILDMLTVLEVNHGDVINEIVFEAANAPGIESPHH